jgi:hypothetical protein
MAGKPTGPGPSRFSGASGASGADEQAQVDDDEDVGATGDHTGAGSSTEPAERVERTGPVVVSRLRKADGRSLILYSTGREGT